MICDDKFLLKGCQPTCCTYQGYVLHGQVLVVGANKADDDFDLLTEDQVDIVIRETRLVYL